MRALLALLTAVVAAGEAVDLGEFLLDTTLVVGPASRDQRYPQAAWDGRSWLVVWEDRRDDYRVVGARLSPDGVLLDRGGIEVQTACRASEPAVAVGGGAFLVVWENYGPLPDNSYNIYAARVTSDGEVLDPEGFPVSAVVGDQLDPAVASDGNGWFVVWQDGRAGGSELYGARVSAAGQVLDSAGIPVLPGTGQYEMCVGFDGENYLAVWCSDSRIEAGRVSQHGVVLDSAPIVVSDASGAQQAPAVVAGSGVVLVVWHDHRSGEDVYGARVSRDGVVLDTAGLEISSGAGAKTEPDVAWDGTNFIAAWRDTRNSEDAVYGSRISEQGIVLDPAGFLITLGAESERYCCAAGREGQVLVGWQGNRDSDYDIYAARVTGLGTVLDSAGVLMSYSANRQYSPAVAWSGSQYFAVWYENRGEGRALYGTRVTPAGVVVDPAGIRVSPPGSSPAEPAVASDGTGFLIVWEDWRGEDDDIYGARVDATGTVLDPSGFTISAAYEDQSDVAVAYSSRIGYVVVWEDWRSEEYTDVYAARVSPGGAVLDPVGIRVTPADEDDQEFPKVAAFGSTALVVWEEWHDGPAIVAARLAEDGAVLDSGGICLAAETLGAVTPVVASAWLNYFVAWFDARGIVGARLRQDGTVLDTQGVLISPPAAYTSGLATAWDGAFCSILWSVYRPGTGSDIFGARVTREGVKHDEFPVVVAERNQYAYGLAAGVGGQMMLTYTGWAGDVGGRTYDVYRAWGKLGLLPGVAETPEQVVRGCPWPSPARGILPLPPGESGALYDHAGRRLAVLRAGPNDVRSLARGVYFLRRQGETRTQKVVVIR